MADLLVPDGVYKIRNVEYSRVVADLINGVQGGPIKGYIDRPTNVNDKWKITNVRGGGNEIIIESVSTPGRFASAEQFPGAELFGTVDNTVWTVVMADVGFNIQSPDEHFVLQLIQDGDFSPILQQFALSIFTEKSDTKWKFDPVE